MGFHGFAVDFLEAGDVGVPFEQDGGGAAFLQGEVEHFPDGVEHGVVVGVEDVLFKFGMAGDVELADAVVRDITEVFVGIEVVVLGGDVDVVDVEEDAAVGLFDDFGEELPFGHFGNVVLGVAGDVFDAHGDFQKIADFADALGGEFGGFLGVGEREQVV